MTVEPETDGTLIERSARGCPDVFVEVVRRHEVAVHGFLARRVGRQVAADLLPRGKKAGRPPTWARRQLIDGIRWRTRTGAPWRDVPPEYGPWQSVRLT